MNVTKIKSCLQLKESVSFAIFKVPYIIRMDVTQVIFKVVSMPMKIFMRKAHDQHRLLSKN